MPKKGASLTQKSLNEIRCYHYPPLAAKTLLTVTLVLLGEDERRAKDWKYCRAYISDSMMQRLDGCDVKQIKPEAAIRTRQIMGGLTVEQLKNVSVTLASLFDWTRSVLDSVPDVDREKATKS